MSSHRSRRSHEMDGVDGEMKDEMEGSTMDGELEEELEESASGVDDVESNETLVLPKVMKSISLLSIKKKSRPVNESPRDVKPAKVKILFKRKTSKKEVVLQSPEDSPKGSPNPSPGRKAERRLTAMKCPHEPCGYHVSVSAFKNHYAVEHANLQRFWHAKGNELRITLPIGELDHSTTICLAIILIAPTEDHGLDEAATVSNESSEHFWLMATCAEGHKEVPDSAYAMFWIFSETENVRCSLRVSPDEHYRQLQVLCDVNSLDDSQHIERVLEKLNCLRVPYSSFISLMRYGYEIKLGIIIH